MQFSLTTLILAAAALTTATPTLVARDGASTQAKAWGPGNGIDVSVYLQCEDADVPNFGWDTRPCPANSRITWWRRGSAWNSAYDCYSACHDELRDRINQGYPDAACSRWVTLAHCEMGYNTNQG